MKRKNLREIKHEKLEQLKQEMGSDTSLPLRDLAENLVFGDGNPNADIVFVGNAPGYEEDKQGLPFVSNSGLIIKRILIEKGMKREDVYLTNLIHYRPPGNRDPNPQEIKQFGVYLGKMLRIIEPKILVALGRFPVKEFTKCVHVSKCHGKIFKEKVHGVDLQVLAMYHPVAAFRSKKIKAVFEKDFLKLFDLLKEIND